MAECAHEGPILIIGGGMADGNAVWSAAGRLQRPTHADQRRTGNAVSAPPLSKTYPRSEESVDGWPEMAHVRNHAKLAIDGPVHETWTLGYLIDTI
jgi:hypothetical protein